MSTNNGRARREARELASGRCGRERLPRPGARGQDVRARRAIPPRAIARTTIHSLRYTERSEVFPVSALINSPPCLFRRRRPRAPRGARKSAMPDSLKTVWGGPPSLRWPSPRPTPPRGGVVHRLPPSLWLGWGSDPMGLLKAGGIDRNGSGGSQSSIRVSVPNRTAPLDRPVKSG